MNEKRVNEKRESARETWETARGLRKSAKKKSAREMQKSVQEKRLKEERKRV